MIRWNQTLLQQVAAARDRALAGLPVALVLEGEPGIGKSTLLREISAGSPGFRVLYANARESVAPAPYRVLEQWLGEAVPALIAPWRAAQHLRNALDERPTLLML
ncbi:MAG TPA: AAA family ATPase, partial [Frankiaceae bacterium]|nr:AAA family ATPase [Frankiaceae bacterium]